MPDTSSPIVLVLASAGHPQLPRLTEVLANLGRNSLVCSQVAQAFVRLARRDPPDEAIVVAIVLEGISGLPVPSLAKSLRGLPGRMALPLILVDAQAVAPVRALAIRQPIAVEDLARLAVQSPEQWPTAPDPAAPAPTAPAIAPPASPAEVILVVDDNDANRTMLRLQARTAGLPIETCTNGAEAVERVAAGGVRLILMDCMMPVMDGYEATRAIRRAEAGTGRHIPILAVTAHVLEDNQRLCREAGMDDFLAKPLDRKHLLDALARWLGQRPAPAPAAQTPASSVVFDPEPLRSIDAQSPGTARQLAGILHADLTPAGASFQRLLASGSWDQLGKTAHKLRGTSGSLGAMELYQTCSVLEQAARTGDPAACALTVAEAIAAIDRLRPVLASVITTPTSP
jgi:CheY-like chemotaxis protein/HPt (histidine-containing phosphotransfer) domain-containing protein